MVKQIHLGLGIKSRKKNPDKKYITYAIDNQLGLQEAGHPHLASADNPFQPCVS